MNLFVSGLGFEVNNDLLEKLFTPYGSVSSSKVIMDRETGRSRGFGFVEMPDASSAAAAMKELNGKVVEGKTLMVNEARPKDNSFKRNNFR